MPDYQARIESLRRLGAEGSGATDAERKLANQRADELEAKYGNRKSPITDDTIVTSRDGAWNPFTRPDGWVNPTEAYQRYYPPPKPGPTAQQAWATLNDLLNRQSAWNRPPEEDIIEKQYRYQPDDDKAEWYNPDTDEWEEVDDAE